ncbi:hypothetical protein CDAR_479891 [Caerostris darwini]|uniref:Uncharacterized protein n=1 Tax=Caerostris darwini TaxID=1538125 RepID=A0AAV4ST80_9ARAC|nr:hypothetical protein CDAR_479891 [Caerostris darwini]
MSFHSASKGKAIYEPRAGLAQRMARSEGKSSVEERHFASGRRTYFIPGISGKREKPQLFSPPRARVLWGATLSICGHKECETVTAGEGIAGPDKLPPIRFLFGVGLS